MELYVYMYSVLPLNELKTLYILLHLAHLHSNHVTPYTPQQSNITAQIHVHV